MRILVADNTGLIKHVHAEDNKVLGIFGKQEVGMPIKNIVRVNTDYFATSHEDRHVRMYCINDANFSLETPLKSQAEIMSLSYSANRILVLQKDGTIFAIDLQYEEEMPYMEEPQDVIKVNATQANRAKLSPFDTSRLLVLCKDTNPQMIDLNEKKQAWKARNVKNDYLDLTVPIYDLDADFRNENEFYVTTAYHKIRLYDIRVKNCKPVVDYEYPHTKNPLNNILLSHDKNFAYVSNVVGNIARLDLRKDFQLIGKLKGAVGCIKEMAMSSTHPYLASVSLDRYLRIYNTNTNKLFQKIYLKQQLSSLILIDETVEERDEDEEKVELFKPYKPQNEVKKAAKEIRSKAKKARMRLPFEVHKKVKGEQTSTKVDQENEEYNEEYEQNDWDENDMDEY